MNHSPTSRARSRSASSGTTSVAFGKLAETCNQYLKKGRQVYIEGRLRTREFEAKNNGGKRQRTEIVASRVQFLGAPPVERSDASAVEEPPIPQAEDVPF